MDAGVAWVLNLDADLELGAGGEAYTPKKSVLDAMRGWRVDLASRLLGPSDLLIDESSPSGAARGRRGRAFCPTPRAVALLERAGAVPEPFPAVEILRRVNGRSFSASLGPTLPHAAFAKDEAEVCAIVASDPPTGFRAWHVKSAFGMAGRGHRVIEPASDLRRDDREYLRSVLRQGHGAMVEPHAEIEREVGIHGVLAHDGMLVLGSMTEQRCDLRGVWIATSTLDESALAAFAWAADLEAEGRRVADALRREGYFGPFNVDAFTYRSQGELRFNPRSEINARYSMGFPEGMKRSTVLRCGP